MPCSRISPLSHGIEGGASAGYSLPPPTIPAGYMSDYIHLATAAPNNNNIKTLDIFHTLFIIYVIVTKTKITFLNAFIFCFTEKKSP